MKWWKVRVRIQHQQQSNNIKMLRSIAYFFAQICHKKRGRFRDKTLSKLKRANSSVSCYKTLNSDYDKKKITVFLSTPLFFKREK